MTATVKNFSDLKDSKLLYEKNLPAFGYFLLILLLALMITVTIWGFYNTKPYIVKGIGTIESPNKNYVMTPFTGEIDDIVIKEGDYVSRGDVLFTMKSPETEAQTEQIEAQKKSYEEQISQYDKLARSIRDNTNYFSPSSAEDSLYYSQYEEYMSQVSQQVVDAKGLKEYGYTDEQIQAELKKNDDKKAELYYTALSNAEAGRKQAERELETLNAQMKAVKKGEKDYTVKASTSGTVHMMTDKKKGMVVQAAEPVASISAENDDFFVKAQISTADRSRIREGCKAELEIAGLQQNVYGTIKGKVTQIDSDMSVTEKGSGYFNIKVVPDKLYLVSKEGNKVNLKSGLQSDVRITYDEITYAAYVLDALGVKD